METILRHPKILLQIRDPVRGCRVDVIFFHRPGDLSLRTDKGDRRVSRLCPGLVGHRKRNHRDILRLLLQLYRDMVIGDSLSRHTRLLQRRGKSDLQVLPQKKKNIERRSSRRNGQELAAIPVGMLQLIIRVDNHAGGHQCFQDPRVQLTSRVLGTAPSVNPAVVGKLQIILHTLHRIRNSRVRGLPACGIVHKNLLIGANSPEHV